MRRGDVILVALSGDYGKPRPAIVVQSDRVTDADSVIVCLLTTSAREAPLFRLSIAANRQTGLLLPSFAMAEKIAAVRRDRCRPAIGRIDEDTMSQLGTLLAFVLGLGER